MSDAQNNAKQRILQKIQLKETLCRIAEHFQDYLFDRVEARIGQRPRFFSIDDISRVKKFGRSGAVNLISVQFGTDIGIQSEIIAVKFFREMDTANEEAKKSQILQDRFKGRKPPVPNTKTPRLLYKDPASSFLVYEGIDGTEYIGADFPPSTKAYLAGRALAAVHGPNQNPIQIDRYEGLVAMSTVQLPGAGNQLKDIFLNLFGKHLRSLTTSNGGTTPFGDFHDGNLLFSQKSSKLGLTNTDPEGIITWIIDPEYLEEATGVSRFEDIGIFFSIFFFEEYEQTQSITKTQNYLQQFIQGYDSAQRMWSAPSLKEMWPDGLPINFDVSLGLLVEGVDILQRYGVNERTKDLYKKRVKFALMLLNEDLIQI